MKFNFVPQTFSANVVFTIRVRIRIPLWNTISNCFKYKKYPDGTHRQIYSTYIKTDRRNFFLLVLNPYKTWTFIKSREFFLLLRLQFFLILHNRMWWKVKIWSAITRKWPSCNFYTKTPTPLEDRVVFYKNKDMTAVFEFSLVRVEFFLKSNHIMDKNRKKKTIFYFFIMSKEKVL